MSGGSMGGDSSGSFRNLVDQIGGDDDCDITTDTVLNSPNSSVIEKLNIGDLLRVELVQEQRKRVEVVSKDGTAGTITSTVLVRLVRCLEAGNTYSAEILSIDSGSVRIKVSRT